MLILETYKKFCIVCESCQKISRPVDDYSFSDICFDEAELQLGGAEGFDNTGWFVDVSHDHGLPEGHGHWCLDCWVQKTKRITPPYRWVYSSAPLMVRLIDDVDVVRRLHLKVEGHR